jgi:hypothetical protein
VELKVNGQSYSGKTSSNPSAALRAGCIFKWPDVSLKEGANTIEAIATRDGKTFTDKCEWKLIEKPKVVTEPNN